MTEQPSLPYPEPGGQQHTMGHSGSETSRDRAVMEANDGTATARQRFVLRRAGLLPEYGVTVKELREATGWHHGKASSVLSTLHLDGRLARLRLARDRCKVYVLPEHVNGRETEEHGRNKVVTQFHTEAEEAAVRRLRFAIRHSFGSQTYVPTSDLITVVELLERQTRG
jgi:hypothetical protein